MTVSELIEELTKLKDKGLGDTEVIKMFSSFNDDGYEDIEEVDVKDLDLEYYATATRRYVVL
jgi:hypothetical protein